MSRSVRLKDQRAEQRLFGRRLIAMTLIVALCAAALVVRLFYLQVLRYDHFSELSQGNRIRIEPVPPARGLIYDRNGEAIALNRPAYQLELIREQTPDLDATLGRLAELGRRALESSPPGRGAAQPVGPGGPPGARPRRRRSRPRHAAS